jgi:hypothetical protein
LVCNLVQPVHNPLSQTWCISPLEQCCRFRSARPLSRILPVGWRRADAPRKLFLCEKSRGNAAGYGLARKPHSVYFGKRMRTIMIEIPPLWSPRLECRLARGGGRLLGPDKNRMCVLLILCLAVSFSTTVQPLSPATASSEEKASHHFESIPLLLVAFFGRCGRVATSTLSRPAQKASS